ncbi:uncharacterized protein Z520_05157 [Fonsecaea multimorphosa CBS 102226]|uniref:AAA+ ATPase domain-containing protein n=1 Tax=Fonsecaea multimorphosa CBS 102226 TaxID=1442371 RepID=A0A0D2IRE3_9EURO|nr:uncharacterized protein Z520_05157 [Fonsecaea multimorphosa CBS 102226]KIX99581.1 hypothetical protein Z520_05157 [Fonsecaea multimorphosa CBS 102226]OAL25409.1 hypothetical protein AYO22_04892 [Fonsecaea multimorphosa]
MALPNQSDPNISSSSIRLPLTILDTLVPGSSHLASFLLGFGLDVSLFVSWSAILATLWAAVRFGLVPAYQTAVKALSSSVIVEEYDPIYIHVLNWASAQKYLQDIRSLRAHSAGQYYNDLEDYEQDEDGLQMRSREGMSEDTIFNFNNWSARAPPTFRPHTSSGWFFHKNRLFKLYRCRDRVASDFTGAVYDRERLEISVIWLSPKPIKSMIQEAREFHLIRRTSKTTIKRPTPKSQRSGRQQAWTTIANRPSRSMATVVLDNDQKAAILKDFNDFLHPRTARWYSNRGIPYRRGYLFHGPPGTGKTSLSFALAGVFGLDIYCLALSEATLTEEDLILLFNSLPKRCILLLEDIDSAGLGRAPRAKDLEKRDPTDHVPTTKKDKQRRKKHAGDNKGDKDDSTEAVGMAAADQPSSFGKEATFKNTLTFAGLLNAIDGVASQEGRVLIMTTNHVERLDKALTRPGRIDLTIKFDLATKQQIKDLFVRMYCVDSVEMRRQPTKISHILPNQVEMANTPKDGDMDRHQTDFYLGRHKDIPKEAPSADGRSVLDLAEQFATSLPERTFSPAEIQGYLLVRKKCPAQAVVDVVQWRDEQLQKKAESSVMKLQGKVKDIDEGRSMASDESEKMAGSSSSCAGDAISDQQQGGAGRIENGLAGELTGGEVDAAGHTEEVEHDAGSATSEGPDGDDIDSDGDGDGDSDNSDGDEHGTTCMEDGDMSGSEHDEDQASDVDSLSPCVRRRFNLHARTGLRM